MDPGGRDGEVVGEGGAAVGKGRPLEYALSGVQAEGDDVRNNGCLTTHGNRPPRVSSKRFTR
jgi:hypothetical protein